MSELRWASWCRHHALVQRSLLHHHLVLVVLVHGIEMHEGGARPVPKAPSRECRGCHREHWNAKLLLQTLLCHQLFIAMCVA